MEAREPALEEVRAVTDELSRLRQRGVERADRQHGRERPIATPLLDELAQQAMGNLPRPSMLSAYLVLVLERYHEQAADSADLLYGLYFDERTQRAPGPGGPQWLLDQARRRAHLSPSAFRRRRRQELEGLARFILMMRPRPEHVVLRVRRRLLVVGLLLTAVLVAVWSLVVAR